jgi:gamma-polyglutamate biosynthesis protein CapA
MTQSQRIDGSATSVRLVAVGDVMLGDSAIATGYGFASRYSQPEATASLASLGHLFGNADVVFGNLECTLSHRGHEPRSWSSTQLRGIPGFADALHQAGFTLMNVANNHASQHGDAAFDDTVAILRRSGIACCGIRGSGGWCSEPVILNVNGRRLGFLGYCLRPRQYSPAIPPYAEGTLNEISADILRLRDNVDHVITSLHWGEEYVNQPSIDEVRIAHGLVAAGTAVILGHHPHVPRPVQFTGAAVIAYSLGNFVSDMIWYEPLREPLVLSVELSDHIERVETERLRISDSYLPVRISPGRSVSATPAVTGLQAHAYQQEIDRTMAEHRLASYGYAARNVHRFRSTTLAQLLAVTVRNKIVALRAKLGFRRPTFPGSS